MIKVAIVEDEPFIRKGLLLTVPWENYDCIVVGEAKNGVEGKAIIEELQPDISIVDVRMPKMDGITMIRELSKKVDCQYIILSGYSEFEYAKQALKLGVKDYLLKPVDDDELLKSISSIAEYIREKKRTQRINEHYNQFDGSKIRFFEEHFIEKELTGKQQYVREAVEYIMKNYSKDINIKDAANYLAISEGYLSRLFKKEVGYTFIEYLTNYRIKKSIELLKDHKVKIYEVAYLVGFNDSAYFSTIFKKYVGISPIDFKDNI